MVNEVALGKVALIAKPGGTQTGVGRYVAMLQHALHETGLQTERVAPPVPPLPAAAYALLRRAGIDLRTFLLNYPVWAEYPMANVYHLTSQNLATLVLLRRPRGRLIVTVHDIIPYMLRNNPQLSSYRTAADRVFDRLALHGLKRADRLAADSHYTKRCVVEQLGIAPERIEVVYLGIDHQRFRPLPRDPALLDRYRLPPDRQFLIYAGSEDPRKNLATLVDALSMVRRHRQHVALIKVGRAHFDQQRARLLDQATRLGVRDAIYFLDEVPEEDLPGLYNLASVCVMPSLYEGFGLPVVEAMACGTPVIYANASSLPELAGDAGLMFDPGPNAAYALTATLMRVLTDAELRRSLWLRGQARAATFRWSYTAARMSQLYTEDGHSFTPATRVHE